MTTVPIAATYHSVARSEFVLLGPGGAFLRVPKELYDALLMFIGEQSKVQKGGQVLVNCNRGNIAGVEVTFKLK
jgi:hypothetical protein